MKSKIYELSPFRLDEALKIAITPDSSSKQLELLVNRNVELNRLLAAHPNSTAALLSALIEYRDEESNLYDVKTIRTAIRHPNILADDALRLGRSFPEDLFDNPSIDSIIVQSPRLLSEDNYLDDNYSMLQAKGCPLSVLQRLAVEGTRAEQAAVARNPSLPPELKNKLTPEYFYKLDLDEILKIASRQDDDAIRSCIDMYANTTRLFCVPEFIPLDRKNPQHRLEDQVFSGFPFTSEEFPWPVEKLGRYMQPIAQIDLAKASSLLGVELGGGLIQVWGGVESGKKVELLTRLVPPSSLANALDWFYPEHAPWLDKSLAFEGCVHSSVDAADFPSFGIDNCRIVWRATGQMFYPSVRDRVFDPQKADRVSHELKGRKNELDLELEAIEEELDVACISRPMSLKCAWGEKPLVVLGGYAQSLGNAWSAHRGDMLFYHSLDYAAMTTVGLTYEIGDDGDPKFSVNWTCDN
jgi:hypothetical protein